MLPAIKTKILEDSEDGILVPAIMIEKEGALEMSIEIPADIGKEFPQEDGVRAVSFQIFNVKGLFPSGIPESESENKWAAAL